MSMMSLAAIALYGAAIVAALSAARRSSLFARPQIDTTIWLLVSLAFALLLVFRLFDGEDLIRNSIREWIKSGNHYDNRRDWQAPLAVVVVVMGAVASFLVWRSWFKAPTDKEGWSLRFAVLALVAFVPLFALRLISFHATDVLLYSGPIRLNWIIELGICAVTMASAIYYGETVKRRDGLHRGRRDRH